MVYVADMKSNGHAARVDTRRRILLPKGSAETGDTFLISVADDGNIHLIRATTVPLGTLGLTDPTS